MSNNSKILKLNPFFDSEGCLRVGGRLKHSDLSLNMKHPLILPQKHTLTNILIEEAHILTMHGGARLTLAYLGQRYWIIGGNNTVKIHLRTCVKCKRFSPEKPSQLMGDLSKSRVTAARPFLNCEVDYAGPVETKCNKGRGIKHRKATLQSLSAWPPRLCISSLLQT